MSYSSQIKEELIKHIGTSRHCQLAELAAIVIFAGEYVKDESGKIVAIRFLTENEGVIRKCFTLLKKTIIMERDLDCGPLSKAAKRQGYCVSREDIPEFDRLIEALASELLTQKACCRRAYLRGAFIAAGTVSDPEKSYHLEISCPNKIQAALLVELFESFDIVSKEIMRQKNCSVYIKDGSMISETLNVMEAHVAMMELENARILKEMRNRVNRKVNCEAANINKTVSASVKQTELIRMLMRAKEFNALPDSLKDMAYLRIEYPDATLKELGDLSSPPIGKSGVNHRLRKLCDEARRLEGGEL